MKLHVILALLIMIAVFALVSCVPSYKPLEKGFNKLSTNNIDEAIDNFNYVIDGSFISDEKKSLAYEGRGWAYYLKGMNEKAEKDFLMASDSSEAKIGLSLVHLCENNLNESLNIGLFILEKQNKTIVDYLPDPLTRQEFLKTLALSSLLIDSNNFSDILDEIEDEGFRERIEKMKDGV